MESFQLHAGVQVSWTSREVRESMRFAGGGPVCNVAGSPAYVQGRVGWFSLPEHCLVTDLPLSWGSGALCCPSLLYTSDLFFACQPLSMGWVVLSSLGGVSGPSNLSPKPPSSLLHVSQRVNSWF